MTSEMHNQPSWNLDQPTLSGKIVDWEAGLPPVGSRTKKLSRFLAMGTLSTVLGLTGCGKDDGASTESAAAIPVALQVDAEPKHETTQVVYQEDAPDFPSGDAGLEYGQRYQLNYLSQGLRFEDPDTKQEIATIPVTRRLVVGNDEASHSVTYVHGFAPCFSTNVSPIEGLPAIVLDAIQGPAGNVRLQFGLELSSGELRDAIEQLVLNEPGETEFLSGRKTKFVAEPVTDFYLVAKDRSHGEAGVIGVAHTRDTDGDQASDLWMDLSPAELNWFVDAANRQTLHFDIRFRPETIGKISGELSAIHTLNIVDQVEQSFSSEQVSGDAPILRGDVADFLHTLKARISTSINVDDESLGRLLLNAAERDVVSHLFAEEAALSMDEFVRRYPGIEAHLADYLRPHLESFRERLAEDDIEVEISQKSNQDTSRTSGGGGFGFSMGPVKIGGKAAHSSQEIKRALERLERSAGVAFEYDEASDSWKPHEISVSAIKTGSREVVMEQHIKIARTCPPSGQYIELAPDLLPSFTGERRRQLLGRDLARENDELTGQVGSLSKENKKLRDKNDELQPYKEKYQKEKKKNGSLADRVDDLESELIVHERGHRQGFKKKGDVYYGPVRGKEKGDDFKDVIAVGDRIIAIEAEAGGLVDSIRLVYHSAKHNKPKKTPARGRSRGTHRRIFYLGQGEYITDVSVSGDRHHDRVDQVIFYTNKGRHFSVGDGNAPGGKSPLLSTGKTGGVCIGIRGYADDDIRAFGLVFERAPEKSDL